MKKNRMMVWGCAASLWAGLTWGGTVNTAPGSWAQTDVTKNVAKTQSVTLGGWGTTNIKVSAVITSGTDIFSASISPTTEVPASTSRTLSLTPLGKAGTAYLTLNVTTGGVLVASRPSIKFSITAVPVITGLVASVAFDEDTSRSISVAVDYWGDAADLAWGATAIGVPSLLNAPTFSGSGLSRTMTLSPVADKYGTNTVRVTVSGGGGADNKNIAVKVNPIADTPVIGTWPTGAIRLDVGGDATNTAFAGVTVADADHFAYVNGTSNEYLKAWASVDAPGVTFALSGGSTTNLTVGILPAGIQSWARSLALYPPETSYMAVGQTLTNTLTFCVLGYGSNDMLSATQTISVILHNPNHPPTYLAAVTQDTLQEGQTVTPFAISQVHDQDAVHTEFSLSLFLDPAHTALASLGPVTSLYGNPSELSTDLADVTLTALSGVMTTPSARVTVYYVLSDTFAYVTNSVTLTITQTRTAPVINGINPFGEYHDITDSAGVSVSPFANVIIYDVDEAGNQPVTAAVTVSNPALGRFELAGLSLAELAGTARTPAELMDLVRQIQFVPVTGALPIGTQSAVTLTLTVTDRTGLSAVNNRITVNIRAVNQAPVLTVPQEQPWLLSPGTASALHPFEAVAVTNDDSAPVTFTIALDNPAKGSLSNFVGGVTVSTPSAGTYVFTAGVAAINDVLTNLCFVLNASYAFPPDDPGGTVFTLTAEDSQYKTVSESLHVQIQESPRNWPVTRLDNDGAAGSLSFALAHAGNNAVITFALPSYPAVIRVADGPYSLTKTLTLKGPGADLLTISGDADGDGLSDGGLFEVASRVTFEGVTLADGFAEYGGAVAVAQTGDLTLRYVALVGNTAERYGGAVDVDGGRLTVENAYFAGNAVVGTEGGGGAISFYTSHDAVIANTTFASNSVWDASALGGGAILAERVTAAAFYWIDVTHCTFTGNADASGTASAIFSDGGGARIRPRNTIFADFSADAGSRNLYAYAANDDVVSLGGNVCDDSTYVLAQLGSSTGTYLLSAPTDATQTDPQLSGLVRDAVSPTPYFVPQAAGLPESLSAKTTDQRGCVRPSRDVPGAVARHAVSAPVISEIQLSSGGDRFVEIYAPRGGGTVDLSGCALLVNGVPVHTFGGGELINSNSTVYPVVPAPAAGFPATYRLAPGQGVLVAFPSGALAGFRTTMAQDNGTPVVRASIVSNANDFARLISSQGRGSVAIVPPALDPAAADPVVRHTFLTVFADPEDAVGEALLDTTGQSVATAPQFRGFAFIPHRFVSSDPNGGWDNPVPPHAEESPGADVDDTPFGQDNARPQAGDDLMTTTEDDPAFLDALANDFDADAADFLVIDALSATSALGAAVTLGPDGLIQYDPTATAALQALPAGRGIIDTFTYSVIDYGTGPVVIDQTDLDFIVMRSPNHRLKDGDEIVIGTHSFWVSQTTNDTFRVTNDFAVVNAAVASGAPWVTAVPRSPTASSAATVTVNLSGLNDNPVGGHDLLVATLTEREAVRLLAQPDLADSAVFSEYPANPVPGTGLLGNDTDVDDGDTSATFRITGVLSAADLHPVTAFAPSSGGTAATITAPAHGLASGAAVVIVGIVNPARLNGPRVVTVLDADTFTLPVSVQAGAAVTDAYWIPAANALTAVTPAGAAVSLITRANPLEDNIVYNAAASAHLQTLAQGESEVDGFWYVFTDAQDAPAVGYVSLTVTGVNNPPDVTPDPPGLGDLEQDGRFGGDTLPGILTNRLDVLTVLVPSESGTAGRADLIVAGKGVPNLSSADLIELTDFFYTDEDTPLALPAADLFANDTDIDTSDLAQARHVVSGAEPLSLRGASVSVDGTGLNVTYDPQGAPELQALAVGETVFDLFTVYVSDGIDAVPSRVAVLVRGVNDAPAAYPVTVTNSAAAASVTFDPIVADIDANDVFAPVTVVVPDPAAPTNVIPYTVTDHSLFLAVDDTFRVAVNAGAALLDVSANDVDFHGTGFGLASVTPSLRGGVAAPAPDARSILYTPPADYAGVDIFSYTVTNVPGVARTANVRVRVIAHDYNGPLQAAEDEYAVARNMSIDMPVTRNDALIPLSAVGILVDPAYNADWPAGLSLADNVFRYTANTAESDITFTYRVTGGSDASGRPTSSSTAQVHVKILDRAYGAQPDFVTAAPGAAPVALDLLANDVIHGDSTAGMRIVALDTAATAGIAVIAAQGTHVLYAAPADFLGVDLFTYTAIDRYGAQGTATVRVTVGIPSATPDSLSVATNTVTVIDVLANDRTLPYAPVSTLTLQSVAPKVGETANGVLVVDGNRLRFTAGDSLNAAAIYFYTASVPNSPVIVTGEVTVVTAAAGVLYANPDNFTVRAGASQVVVDVLGNDVSYVPSAHPLSVYAAQAYSQEGGTIVQDGNILRYTPPAGFTGVDTFLYSVADGVTQQSGRATLRVIPGDLIANDDAFIAGYEWDGHAGQAAVYALPVLGNDAVFPGGGVAVNLTTNFGIGAHAPQYGSSVEVSPDKQTVLFRPGQPPALHPPTNEYIETFTYEVEDAFGRKQSASVSVTVRSRVSAIDIETQDDAFVVERGSSGNLLDVTANDLVAPQTPISPAGIHVTASANHGQITVDGLRLDYTPPADFVGIDTATYTISDGLGGSGTANVKIYVGALPTAPDAFTALRGTPRFFDVVANDAVTSDYLASYEAGLTRVMDVSQGGIIEIVDGWVRYEPDPAYSGSYPYTETFRYELTDNSGRLTVGTVSVTVYDLASSQASSVVYVINPSGGGVLPASPERAAWDAANFTADQIAAGAADGTADIDGDGLSNDAEYAFGGDPNVADSTDFGIIHIRAYSDGSVDIFYVRRSNDSALTFHLYGKASLSAADPWTQLNDSQATVATTPFAVGDSERVNATHSVAAPSAYRFFKIVVE